MRLLAVSSVQQKLSSEAMQKLFEAHQIMVLERDKHMLDRMLSAGVHVAVLGYLHGITMEREKFYGRKIMFKNIVRGKDIFHAGPVFFYNRPRRRKQPASAKRMRIRRPVK